ncbi:MAG: DUF6438 domain-containing protein, partial [Planctomyces sp.]
MTDGTAPQGPAVVYGGATEADSLFFSLERTPCFGQCKTYRIRVYRSGFAVYEGSSFVEKTGTHYGHVGSDTLALLLRKAQEVDFFNLQPVAGSLSGTIWNDLNGDGIFGTGEPPLAGWTVYVDLNSDGSLTAGEPASVTAGAGTWAFPSQAYGTKTVRVIPQPNWAVTSPATGSATFLLLNGQARTAVNFGLRELVGDVRGVVVDDANGNGIQDAGELPLSDQTVFADLNSDGLLTAGEPAAVTAADGSWLISRLPSGTRSIVHQLPAGRIPSIGAPAVRSLSVGIGTTSVADFFTLIPAAGSVAGRVFSDVASDGIFNAGDAPLEGWQVFADLNANTVFDAGEPNVLSAADGSYLLSGLAYGPVTIRQTMLPGFTATTFPAGAAILLLNGENRTG